MYRQWTAFPAGEVELPIYGWDNMENGVFFSQSLMKWQGIFLKSLISRLKPAFAGVRLSLADEILKNGMEFLHFIAILKLFIPYVHREGRIWLKLICGTRKYCHFLNCNEECSPKAKAWMLTGSPISIHHQAHDHINALPYDTVNYTRFSFPRRCVLPLLVRKRAFLSR